MSSMYDTLLRSAALLHRLTDVLPESPLAWVLLFFVGGGLLNALLGDSEPSATPHDTPRYNCNICKDRGPVQWSHPGNWCHTPGRAPGSPF